jgi:PKD repeat protein
VREEILRRFERFRRRHLWVRGWDLFLQAAFVMTVTVAAMLLVDRLAFELKVAAPHLSRPGMVVATMAGALVLAALTAGATLLLRPTPPVEIAWRLDRATGGEERFLSALELAVAGSQATFSGALWRDAARVADTAAPARVVPHERVGYRWGILLSLAAAAALLAAPPRVYAAPAADFDASTLRGPAPLEVEFADASVGAIDRFEWDFGDGQKGHGERAAHVYEKPGRYEARLRLEGPGGRSEKAVTIEVLPPDRASADFEAEPVKGRAPLEVRFRNLSRNAKRHAWDFGDGVSSADEAPAHTYGKPGLYTVRLRASNDLGSDERVREKLVKVAHEDEPLADFRALPREGPAPLAVEFEDLSTGAVAEWHWDFGDLFAGEKRTARDRNPAHVFRVPGRYTVRLRVVGPHGEDLEEKARYIHVTDDEGGGRGGGGSGSAGKAPGAGAKGKGAGNRSSSGAGAQDGVRAGPRADRPEITTVPEGVTPHQPGGELVEKDKRFLKRTGGGGEAQEVPYTDAFREYERVAEDSISRERIPPAVRDTVRRYFESLRPK